MLGSPLFPIPEDVPDGQSGPDSAWRIWLDTEASSYLSIRNSLKHVPDRDASRQPKCLSLIRVILVAESTDRKPEDCRFPHDRESLSRSQHANQLSPGG